VKTHEEQNTSACLSNRLGETVGTDKLLGASLDENRENRSQKS